MTTKTIEYIKPGQTEWKSDDGQLVLYYITCIFSDGSEGSPPGATSGNVDAVRSSLQALVGTPTEYDLEFKKNYNGTDQFKIKSWPGKPKGTGGGSGGGGGGGMKDEAVAFIAAAAFASGNGVTMEQVTFDAQLFLAAYRDFLKMPGVSQQNEAQKAEEPAPAAQEAAQPQAAPPVAAASRISLATVRQLKELAYELGKAPADVVAEIGRNELSELAADEGDLLLKTWQEQLAKT